MQLCDWISDRHTRVCVAEALPDDRYCAAHRAMANAVKPRPLINRREYQDADLLPLTPEELRQLAELRERSKGR